MAQVYSKIKKEINLLRKEEIINRLYKFRSKDHIVALKHRLKSKLIHINNKLLMLKILVLF